MVFGYIKLCGFFLFKEDGRNQIRILHLENYRKIKMFLSCSLKFELTDIATQKEILSHLKFKIGTIGYTAIKIINFDMQYKNLIDLIFLSSIYVLHSKIKS